MPRSRRGRIVAGLFAVTLVLAACGGDDEGGGETGGGQTGAGDTGAGDTGGGGSGTPITIEGFAFDPTTVQISGETSLSITNNDSAPHTFTLDDDSVDQAIPPGSTVDVTVNPSETTGFHCEIHPSMTGTLEVA
jgi:plastocyanin